MAYPYSPYQAVNSPFVPPQPSALFASPATRPRKEPDHAFAQFSAAQAQPIPPPPQMAPAYPSSYPPQATYGFQPPPFATPARPPAPYPSTPYMGAPLPQAGIPGMHGMHGMHGLPGPPQMAPPLPASMMQMGGGYPGAQMPPVTPYMGIPHAAPAAPAALVSPVGYGPKLTRPKHQEDNVDKWLTGKDYGPVLNALAISILAPPLPINPLLIPPTDEPQSHPRVMHDLLFPPGAAHLSTEPAHRSWSAGRDAPATFPRVEAINLVSPHFPWAIRIPAGSKRRGVTCGDVFEELFRALRGEHVSKAEFAAAPLEQQAEMSRTYHFNRSTSLGAVGGTLGQGMRRIDWLGSRTMFDGIVRDNDFVREKFGLSKPVEGKDTPAWRNPGESVVMSTWVLQLANRFDDASTASGSTGEGSSSEGSDTDSSSDTSLLSPPPAALLEEQKAKERAAKKAQEKAERKAREKAARAKVELAGATAAMAALGIGEPPRGHHPSASIDFAHPSTSRPTHARGHSYGGPSAHTGYVSAPQPSVSYVLPPAHEHYSSKKHARPQPQTPFVASGAYISATTPAPAAPPSPHGTQFGSYVPAAAPAAAHVSAGAQKLAAATAQLSARAEAAAAAAAATSPAVSGKYASPLQPSPRQPAAAAVHPSPSPRQAIPPSPRHSPRYSPNLPPNPSPRPPPSPHMLIMNDAASQASTIVVGEPASLLSTPKSYMHPPSPKPEPVFTTVAGPSKGKGKGKNKGKGVPAGGAYMPMF